MALRLGDATAQGIQRPALFTAEPAGEERAQAKGSEEDYEQPSQPRNKAKGENGQQPDAEVCDGRAGLGGGRGDRERGKARGPPPPPGSPDSQERSPDRLSQHDKRRMG